MPGRCPVAGVHPALLFAPHGLNNPLRYADPTGHVVEEATGDVDCVEECKVAFLGAVIKRSKRSDFEKDALNNLLNAGGEGLHVVDYVVQNNVAIGFHWHLYAGAYWDDDNNALYLNRDEEETRPDDPFVLNLIAHEVTHLEGGSTWALSKIGELEAWKVGFTIQNYFRPLKEGTPEYQIVNDLEIWDTDGFTDLVHEYNKNVPRGWIYNFLFDLLPSSPLGVQVSFGR